MSLKRSESREETANIAMTHLLKATVKSLVILHVPFRGCTFSKPAEQLSLSGLLTTPNSNK